jgi:hypothetical protein
MHVEHGRRVIRCQVHRYNFCSREHLSLVVLNAEIMTLFLLFTLICMYFRCLFCSVPTPNVKKENKYGGSRLVAAGGKLA